MKKNYGIHWFRRDLRVHGNSALRENFLQNKGDVLGVFFFDSDFLSRPDFSHRRFEFFLLTLKKLKEDLVALGGDLLVLDQLPVKGFADLIGKLRIQNPDRELKLVTWNRDYEPFARKRDQNVRERLTELSVPHQDFRDHLIFEPHEITKPDGKGIYQIYSPFLKTWKNSLATTSGRIRLQFSPESLGHRPAKPAFNLKWSQLGIGPEQDRWESFFQANRTHVDISVPKEVGFAAAREHALAFQSKVQDYPEARDIPSQSGTSKLSMYFKNGSITSAQVLSLLEASPESLVADPALNKFFQEIVWREFYYHILWHRPSVETNAFLERFNNMKWSQNQGHLEAWKRGLTGFPWVDAGMRELAATGWMHNRVRMGVASFLCKDLLLDWRLGEAHFMKQLLDGDLAPNNGGWQWAASTGCDPQPYFRIFNPWLQSAKFDPQGLYIKKWIPELSKLPSAALHNPEASRPGYPRPIVDHALQKKLAIQLYSAAK